jgi:hypothetical protein
MLEEIWAAEVGVCELPGLVPAVRGPVAVPAA